MTKEQKEQREQIAKEVLMAMLTGNNTTQYGVIKQAANAAVYAADALMESLAVEHGESIFNG